MRTICDVLEMLVEHSCYFMEVSALGKAVACLLFVINVPWALVEHEGMQPCNMVDVVMWDVNGDGMWTGCAVVVGAGACGSCVEVRCTEEQY